MTVTEPSSEAAPIAQPPVLVADAGAVRTLTLNRPDKHNALDGETLRQLQESLLRIQQDSTVRAVIITGAALRPGSSQERRSVKRRPTSVAVSSPRNSAEFVIRAAAFGEERAARAYELLCREVGAPAEALKA